MLEPFSSDRSRNFPFLFSFFFCKFILIFSNVKETFVRIDKVGVFVCVEKQAKKITAKNEKEATAADLETAKMQVEAADAAEETKNRLNKSQ